MNFYGKALNLTATDLPRMWPCIYLNRHGYLNHASIGSDLTGCRSYLYRIRSCLRRSLGKVLFFQCIQYTLWIHLKNVRINLSKYAPFPLHFRLCPFLWVKRSVLREKFGWFFMFPFNVTRACCENCRKVNNNRNSQLKAAGTSSYPALVCPRACSVLPIQRLNRY